MSRDMSATNQAETHAAAGTIRTDWQRSAAYTSEHRVQQCSVSSLCQNEVPG
jgi:hypothetical protein